MIINIILDIWYLIPVDCTIFVVKNLNSIILRWIFWGIICFSWIFSNCRSALIFQNLALSQQCDPRSPYAFTRLVIRVKKKLKAINRKLFSIRNIWIYLVSEVSKCNSITCLTIQFILLISQRIITNEEPSFQLQF